ncbi:MAG: H+transporting two-sector ATPase subunit [Clostridia bacterium]|jgi:V/A-type H+-transporting ATPase subunit E|nr:H+transporting two-sector ATPase subunit [Clostridia bacterium]
MVTIEQKLTLFSKLLHQDIKQEIDNKMIELDKEYEQKILKDKKSADKAAETIIQNAVKRAEAKKTELISKGKMSSKREMMLAKERYITTFIENLKRKIRVFTQTEAYKAYLGQYLNQFKDLNGYENDLIIYMTQLDYNNHKEYVKEKLISLGLNGEKLSFQITDDSILGGIIVEDPKLNMRIDTSIAALIQDSKGYIIESVFGAIGEVGEILE